VRRFVDCVSRDTNSVRNFRHRRWLVANTRIADQWTAMLGCWLRWPQFDPEALMLCGPAPNRGLGRPRPDASTASWAN
jgi:hypothetical protein